MRKLIKHGLAMGKISDYSKLKRFVLQRSVLKRDVYELGKKQLALLKGEVAAHIERLSADVGKVDKRLEIKFHERNEYEFACTIAGDYLLFNMHTNVFRIDTDMPDVPFGTYLTDDPNRAYCAVIHVYNFLADSFRFERGSDAGYLVARIFINAENHFFVEGINSLGERFSDFANATFDAQAATQVVLAVMLEALNFELLVPEYALVSDIALTNAIRTSGLTGRRTDKRLGFKLQAERLDEE